MAKLEEHALFNDYVAAPIVESEIKAKPAVLLIGQYSTGKTTFIQCVRASACARAAPLRALSYCCRGLLYF